ncbi:MAG: DUF4278 domain-containing protein [Microcoleaceae cyanobacterium]
MNLTYRGIDYSTQMSPIDMAEGELTGKYRGQAYPIIYPRHIPLPHCHRRSSTIGVSPVLKYRGITYQSSEYSPLTARGSIGSEVIPSNSNNIVRLDSPVSSSEASTTPVDDVAVTHQSNVCRILERRRQVAELKGDKQLLKALDREARQLACSV